MSLFRYLWVLLIFAQGFSQTPVGLHSHNDYSQRQPFWSAYANGFSSIEADVFYKNDSLYVTHHEKEIIQGQTLEALYLEPLRQALQIKYRPDSPLQLLIDVKSDALPTLAKIVKTLDAYPDLTSNESITFVISGNRPPVEAYIEYPDAILFDYQSLEPIPYASAKKVALVSLGFGRFSNWNGTEPMPEALRTAIKKIVQQAHDLHKPFRFWGVPDTPLAWKTMAELGVDFINTDHPFACARYFEIPQKKDIPIAFLADVHFQDVYGTPKGTDEIIKTESAGNPVLMRTMESQLHSTRIFNENYFAFKTALDTLAKQGINYVALPGDYTDDGQPIHLLGLKKMLDEYRTTYGMRFFITTGNHDPNSPFGSEGGKSDFLSPDGKPMSIVSNANLSQAEKAIISPDLRHAGYEEIMTTLGDYGFFPKPFDLYWATPFSDYNWATYSYAKAKQQSTLSRRIYKTESGESMPDASYVVEPVPGIWLLAIDGDVFLPEAGTVPQKYRGTGIGYKNILKHKRHLLEWVREVYSDAKKNSKTVVAFCHFPLVSFNDGADTEMEQLFGENSWQAERIPSEEVANEFANAGITVHVAGHMHLNDTGVRNYENGKNLVNIQTPSLAAYLPGYKVLKISGNGLVEVSTEILENVPGFDTLFPFYENEYKQEKERNTTLWPKDILEVKSYREFTERHLQNLIKQRFLKTDWPEHLKNMLVDRSMYDFVTTDVSPAVLSALFRETDLTASDLKEMEGGDVITDLYKLRSADVLAFQDIGEGRVVTYKKLFGYIQNHPNTFNKHVVLFSGILLKFMNGAPVGHFYIDAGTGQLYLNREAALKVISSRLQD